MTGSHAVRRCEPEVTRPAPTLHARTGRWPQKEKDTGPIPEAHPVVYLDETSRQLFGEVRQPQPVAPGRAVKEEVKEDYEYERKGTCNLFLMCEPLREWRSVRVTNRRTRKDYAECLQQLVDVHYPHARKVVLIQDNLNTHSGGSLYERYPPPEARRILNRIEFHYTPKHGSWLNMAESEIGILGPQCLDRRLDCRTKLAHEVAAWQEQRKVYPTIED